MKNITLFLVTSLFLVACSNQANMESKKAISDTSLGLRTVSLSDEKDVKIPNITWVGTTPGENKKFDRSFENAPPLIPHSLEDLVPITKDFNSCLSCHMPDVAADAGATPVPKTHLIDFRTGKYLNGALSDERFNCTQCHVPQANAQPLVKNSFKPDFRNKKTMESSDLIDVLDEGVK